MDLKKSVVFSRTFFLLILAVVFSCGLMAVWSTFLTGHFQTRVSVDQLTQQARQIAQVAARFEAGQLTGDAYNEYMREVPELLQCAILIDVGRDVSWARSRLPQNAPWSDEEIAQAQTWVSTYRNQLQTQDAVAFQAAFSPQEPPVSFVGVPIHSLRPSGEEILGGVFLFQALSANNIFSFPLLLSSAAALLLTLAMMSIPTFYFIRLMVKPLLNIRDISRNISEGDFSSKVNEDYRGEFGELACSINQMSDNLQLMIGDLESESKRLHQILNALNEGIIAFSAQGALTFMNPTFCQTFPAAAQWPQPLTLDQFPLPDLAHLVRQALSSGERQTLNWPWKDRQYYLQAFVLQNREGQIRGVVLMMRDVTEEARLEQTRRDYVANVSHELKTPLTALRCLVEPLMDGLINQPEDRQRSYQILYDETLRMSRLIDDMLELSRLQTGQMILDLEAFQVQTLMENLYAKFSTLAQERGIHLALELPDARLPLAYANPDRTEQIIYIYLDNALKFTPPGGAIILGAQLHQNEIVLSVQDTGAGISEEDQAHVFERFYKADKSRGSVGTGLGLSIAKEISERMQQRVWVESKLGQGSTFYLSLQIDQAPKQPIARV